MLAGQVRNAPDGSVLHDWTGQIPGSFVDSTGVDYYLESLGTGGLARTPAGLLSTDPAPYHVHAVNPPVPQHVPTAFAVDGAAIPIELRSTCSTSSCTARLYYRTTPNSTTPIDTPLLEIPDWPSVAMQQSADVSLGDIGRELTFTASIPADAVDTRGVDYFMVVEDGSTRSFWPGTTYQGYLPTDGVRTGFMHVQVLETPHLAHVPVLTAPYGEPISIDATGNCSMARDCTARLYWRTTTVENDVSDAVGGTDGSDATFSSAAMEVTRTGQVTAAGQDAVTLSGEIPAEVVDTRGVDYFFSMTDGPTTTWWPGTSQISGYVAVPGTRVGYHHTRVLEPPHIVPTTPPVATPATDFQVTIAANCATEKCSARLFYAQRDLTEAISLEPTTFSELPMSETGNPVPTALGGLTQYAATIPASDVTTRGLVWFAKVSDGYTSAYAPGTSYNGAYVPVDGHQLPPAGYPTTGLLGVGTDKDLGDQLGLPRGTAAFPVRVLEPPHVVHVPSVVIARGEPLTLSATSNCAVAECVARLHYTDTEGYERRAAPIGATGVPGGVWSYTFKVPRKETLAETFSYRISVSDGWVSDTTPTYQSTTDETLNLGVLGGTVGYDLDDSQDSRPTEPKLAGVSVKVAAVGLDGVAFTVDDLPIGSDVTDADGRWAVRGLVPGVKYAITLDRTILPSTVKSGNTLIRQTRTLTVSQLSIRDVDFALPSADVDADGVPDVWEAQLGIPRVGADTDGDGLSDHYEINYLLGLTDPEIADTDGDGVSDAAEDPDGDGWTNAVEHTKGTSPTESDTDHDGLRDAREGVLGSDPLRTDSDGDGWLDGVEDRNATSPVNVDTDGDGVSDPDDVVVHSASAPWASVEVTGTGDVAGALSIEPAELDHLQAAPGIVSSPVRVELTSGMAELTSATLSIPVPSTFTGDRSKLHLFYFNQTTGTWMPGAVSDGYDQATGAVVGQVDHFSVWAIFELTNWNSHLTGLTARCDDGRRQLHVDVAFVLDDSGSMTTNDPNRLRVQAAKNFVDAFDTEDRGAVITFTTSAQLRAGLTSDTSVLKGALDGIGAGAGGTNISTGVQTALDQLTSASDRQDRIQTIILLTDGIGDYSSSHTARARQENITINTIAMAGANQTLLSDIAAGSGGTAHTVATADDLPEVFRVLDGEVQGSGRDTDGDGLADCDELGGLVTPHAVYHTNPYLADTDGDGLEDSEELRLMTRDEVIDGFYYHYSEEIPDQVYGLVSDPTLTDTDGDGPSDGIEVSEEDTNPLHADTDSDDLPDLEEYNWDSDSSPDDDHEGDTDHDGRPDGDDAANGFTPIDHDDPTSKATYLVEATKGCGLGDFAHIDTKAELTGNLACSLVPGIDIRDFVAGALHGDETGMVFSAAGLIPFAGDYAKGAKIVEKYAENTGDLATATRELAELSKQSERIADVAREIDRIGDGVVTALREAAPGISDRAIVALAKTPRRPTNLTKLKATLERVKGVDNSVGEVRHGELPQQFTLRNGTTAQLRPNGYPKNATDAEAAFVKYATDLDPAATVTQQTYIRADGFIRGRYIDACTNCLNEAGEIALTSRTVLREAKSGGAGRRLDSKLQKQINKDAKILEKNPTAKIEWHFMASDYGLDVSTDVLQELQAKGIKYVIHLPA